jgi:glycosyltransferase involved in cell wall biosynthesis
LKDVIPDIKLILVGEGPEMNNYKRQTTNYKLQNQIEFLGRVSEEKKLELLIKSHIHVLPSAVEGFGLVTIEALSAGTPVVNADIPINREILNGQKVDRLTGYQVKGGLLFNLGDYVDLAEKIETLLTDKKLYSRKVKEGLELIKKYNWDEINKKTEDYYQNICHSVLDTESI